MATALNPYSTHFYRLSLCMRWYLVAGGLLSLYVPTYFNLITETWKKPEYAHGFIVFLIALAIFWKNRNVLSTLSVKPRGLTGGCLLAWGLAMYVIGRSQDILLLEVGSQLFVLSGILLLLYGLDVLRKLWFPVLFLVFLVPLPTFFIDTLTTPLKQHVSDIVEQLLYFAGYPIARSGVVLTIGPYQLLIADACSGLNSMFALSAMGILFIYLRGRANTPHNVILLASIIPIAFLANILRVIFLVLITFYLGDVAGQGFLHDAAGITEFTIALLALFALDSLVAVMLVKMKGVKA